MQFGMTKKIMQVESQLWLSYFFLEMLPKS